MTIRASGACVLAVLAAASVGVACSFADNAGDDANHYGAISNRNAFHLSSPPLSAAPEQKVVDVPKLVINGFYKIGGNTRVLLAMPPKGKDDVTKYFNLAAGERDSSVEIVKINAGKGEVEIINSGTRMILSLASNAAVAKVASSETAGGAPPAPDLSAGHKTGVLSPGASQPTEHLAGVASATPGANSAVATSGGDSGSGSSSASDSGSGVVYAGGFAPGRNIAAGGSGGGASEPGNGSSAGGVIVAGGNPATFAGSSAFNDAAAAAEASGAVYFPPNPGSAAANTPGVNVGEALANPQNNIYRTPPRSTGP
jgi:hypothetical protein